jgi:Glycosyl hydrolase family 1
LSLQLGWFAHPVYSQTGDYPAVMKEYVARHSSEEGLLTSRLPEFTAEEIEMVKGSN